MHSKLQLGLSDKDNSWFWGFLVGISHSPFKRKMEFLHYTQGGRGHKDDKTVAEALLPLAPTSPEGSEPRELGGGPIADSSTSELAYRQDAEGWQR